MIMVRCPDNGPVGPAAGAAESRGSAVGVIPSGAAMFRSLAVSVLLIGAGIAWGQEKPTAIPPPAPGEAHASGTSEKADLAGGCYWGTQGVFEHVRGIKRVVAGFHRRTQRR